MNTVEGVAGSAVELHIPDVPMAMQTVTHWLITAPVYHPLWSQYVLACVRLDNVPGFKPPRLQFQGATHELIVMALAPGPGPYDEGRMAEYWRSGDLPFLTPINIVEQFEATDDEMRLLCQYAAMAVVHGWLNPETADAPELVRENWLASLTTTLAHIRGEAHAP